MISCCQSMDPVRSNQVHPYMQKGVILKVAPNSNKSASVTFHYCYQQTKLSLQPSFLIMISTSTATARLVGSDDSMPTCVLAIPNDGMEWTAALFRLLGRHATQAGVQYIQEGLVKWVRKAIFFFPLLSLPLETGKQRKDDEWMDGWWSVPLRALTFPASIFSCWWSSWTSPRTPWLRRAGVAAAQRSIRVQVSLLIISQGKRRGNILARSCCLKKIAKE